MSSDGFNGCGVVVSCRLRALAAAARDDAHDAEVLVVDVSTPCVIAVPPTHSFTFDHVLSPTASQNEVFETIGLPCVRDLLLGYNCTVLAYGQTSSGKTHTTVGDVDSEDNRGLIPRLLDRLVSECDTTGDNVQLCVSFVEIYQERVRDLLRPRTSSTALRIREDPHSGGAGVWVDGATEVEVNNLPTAIAVLKRGLVQRAVGGTRLNSDSSRSHAVFAVTMTRRSTSTRGRLCIVDLAGSEQAKKSLATATRLDEAKHINRSLSALGNVIHALTSPTPTHVPYRDSKLTRLLQSSLGGNAKTHLLLTCAVAARHVDESLATLRFGARTKRMRNQPTINSQARGQSVGDAALATLENKVRSLCAYIRELEESRRCRHCQADADTNTDTNNTIDMDDTIADADTNDVGAHDHHLSADIVMQSELAVLRRAMEELRHEYAHADALAQSLQSVEATEQQRLLRQQASAIERLEEENDALEQQIHANADEFRRESQRSELAWQRERAARDAESEILRRQIDATERQLKAAQLELSASRNEQRELQNLLASKQREIQSMMEENSKLSRRITQAERDEGEEEEEEEGGGEEVVSVRHPPPPMNTVKPRPITVGNGGGTSLAIQSWWAGNNSGGDEEGGSGGGGRQGDLKAVSPPSRRVRVRSRGCGGSADAPLDGGGEGERRGAPRCLHTSGGVRARLVGLLSSLEEETSSYKELLQGVGGGGSEPPLLLPRPTRGGRRRNPTTTPLPELER